ncbi:uncharacterized protein VP01_938g1 [Puccinia sorghi]|uniref:Uncharacterized protein n=1 Tax=Puccinia sorghi TaxID=27349 RepID=A0A0L6U6U1_9BASI|nr:uncharacterized protein VP01_938g1 [Puccinia sorghi]
MNYYAVFCIIWSISKSESPHGISYTLQILNLFIYSTSPSFNLKTILKIILFLLTKVYVYLNEVLSVKICVFRAQYHTHQTLKRVYHSEKYARIGFSFQRSQKLSYFQEASTNDQCRSKYYQKTSY